MVKKVRKWAWTPFSAISVVNELSDGEWEEDDETVIDAIQYLIDSGYAWTLPGSYGRLCQRYIDQGYCIIQ